MRYLQQSVPARDDISWLIKERSSRTIGDSHMLEVHYQKLEHKYYLKEETCDLKTMLSAYHSLDWEDLTDFKFL